MCVCVCLCEEGWGLVYLCILPHLLHLRRTLERVVYFGILVVERVRGGPRYQRKVFRFLLVDYTRQWMEEEYSGGDGENFLTITPNYTRRYLCVYSYNDVLRAFRTWYCCRSQIQYSYDCILMPSFFNHEKNFPYFISSFNI